MTAHVLPYHDDGFAQSVTLRDGCVVVVRPIGPDDKDRLVAGLARLSEESAYRRFLAPHGTFTHDELVYLTEVDHHDHEGSPAATPAPLNSSPRFPRPVSQKASGYCSARWRRSS